MYNPERFHSLTVEVWVDGARYTWRGHLHLERSDPTNNYRPEKQDWEVI